MSGIVVFFLAVLAFLGVMWGAGQYVQTLQNCNGVVVQTVNPFDPYACLPEAGK